MQHTRTAAWCSLVRQPVREYDVVFRHASDLGSAGTPPSVAAIQQHSFNTLQTPFHLLPHSAPHADAVQQAPYHPHFCSCLAVCTSSPLPHPCPPPHSHPRPTYAAG
jgi:hypothetical protein